MLELEVTVTSLILKLLVTTASMTQQITMVKD